MKLSVAAVDARGRAVVDFLDKEISVREDGRPARVVFFRFAGSKRQFAAAPGTDDYANRPSPIPTVILLDRWNERLLTTADSSAEVTHALHHLELSGGIYVYFLTNHGDLFSVHPLPGTDADLRGATHSSPVELAAKLEETVRDFAGFRDTEAQDWGIRVNATFQALDSLGMQMASIPGRKNLIWITHGLPLYTDLMPVVRRFGAASVRAGITIYTVDQSAAGVGATPDLSSATLQMLSSLTGGHWYPSNAMERAFGDAIVEKRSHYTIAYYSRVEGNAKYHKIRVTSARKRVRLYTWDGFFENAVQPQLDDVENAAFSAARRSPFDATEVGLRVLISPGPSSKAVRLRIQVNPADVMLELSDTGYQGHLSLSVAAYSQGFLKQASAPVEMDLDLSQEQLGKAIKVGITILKDVSIGEDIQKLRVIVFDRALCAVGSVSTSDLK
jgi:VWFA-related protein